MSNRYDFCVSLDINALPRRVWRALCDPAEVVQWDRGVTAAIEAPADYPQPGQHVRWRYRHWLFPILHDRPQAVVAERTLRALLAVGPSRIDETYTLEPLAGACRLSAALQVTVAVPLIGAWLARSYVGPQTETAVRASLDALKQHCETRCVSKNGR